MSDHEEGPPADIKDVSQVAIYLQWMRADARELKTEVRKLVAAMPEMATKADIAELSRKFEGYATHDDVRALRTDLELVRQQVENGSVPGSVKWWADWAQRFSAIAAFIAVAVVSVAHLVHLYDRVPAEPVKVAPK